MCILNSTCIKTELLILGLPPKYASPESSLFQEMATPFFGVLVPNTGTILDSLLPLNPTFSPSTNPVGYTPEMDLRKDMSVNELVSKKLLERCLAYNKH